MWKAIKHDLSKYSKDEASAFTKAGRLKNLTYGSDEYKLQIRELLGPALDHHYEHNAHHPEHYKRLGIDGMDLLTEIEMLVDWRAATLRHKDGNIGRSIIINQERFGYDSRRARRYHRTIEALNLELEN